jgi:hypothetical protein
LRKNKRRQCFSGLQFVWKAKAFCADRKQRIFSSHGASPHTQTLEMTMNFRTLAAVAVAALILTATASKAEILLQSQPSEQGYSDAADAADSSTDAASAANDRLMIVNGNNGHVIYDDGRDDLFCVTRKVIVGYNEYGYPIRKRTMRCR